MIGTAIYQQAMQLYNWPFAAAIAMILIALVLVVFTITTLLPKKIHKNQGGVAGREENLLQR